MLNISIVQLLGMILAIAIRTGLFAVIWAGLEKVFPGRNGYFSGVH